LIPKTPRNPIPSPFPPYPPQPMEPQSNLRSIPPIKHIQHLMLKKTSRLLICWMTYELSNKKPKTTQYTKTEPISQIKYTKTHIEDLIYSSVYRQQIEYTHRELSTVSIALHI
jgi:hypothetical protein